jgi:hypothetical protein
MSGVTLCMRAWAAAKRGPLDTDAVAVAVFTAAAQLSCAVDVVADATDADAEKGKLSATRLRELAAACRKHANTRVVVASSLDTDASSELFALAGVRHVYVKLPLPLSASSNAKTGGDKNGGGNDGGKLANRVATLVAAFGSARLMAVITSGSDDKKANSGSGSKAAWTVLEKALGDAVDYRWLAAETARQVYQL